MDWDDERTPTVPHPKPAPVVVRAGHGPRSGTPIGGLLAPLGVRVPVPDPEVFLTDDPPTGPLRVEHRAARLVRNWAACTERDRRLIEEFALRLRPGRDGGG